MNWIKRTGCSIKQKWQKTVLFTLLFSVIFTVTIGSVVLYQSSSAQIEHMERTVASSVTLKPPYMNQRSPNVGYFVQIEDEDIADAFIGSSYVNKYNYYFSSFVNLFDCTILYADEMEENKGLKRLVYDTSIRLVVNSEYDIAFTVNGYGLIKGRHFTEGDRDKNICLISEQFAAENDYTVGDTFLIAQSKLTQASAIEDALVFSIIGIFTAPDSSYPKGIGDRPEELIFVPYDAAVRLSERLNFNTGFRSYSISVYLNSMDDIDAFIEETKAKLNIRNVYESHYDVPASHQVPADLMGATPDETGQNLRDNPIFDLYIDREWYDMTMQPIRQVNTLAGILTVALLAAAVLVLSLISVLSLKGRNREIGALLAMGESKSHVVEQILLESFLPVLFAMLIGILAGVLGGTQITESLGDSIYNQTAEVGQVENDIYTFASKRLSYVAQEMNAGSAIMDLSFVRVYDVVIPPRIPSSIGFAEIALFLLFSLAGIAIVLLIQLIWVVRIKPARILSGRY